MTEYSPNACCKSSWILYKINMLGYSSLGITSSLKPTVFFEFCSQNIVHFSEQIMSMDKYLSKYFRAKWRIIYCLYMNRSVYASHLVLKMFINTRVILKTVWQFINCIPGNFFCWDTLSKNNRKIIFLQRVLRKHGNCAKL